MLAGETGHLFTQNCADLSHLTAPSLPLSSQHKGSFSGESHSCVSAHGLDAHVALSFLPPK